MKRFKYFVFPVFCRITPINTSTLSPTPKTLTFCFLKEYWL